MELVRNNEEFKPALNSRVQILKDLNRGKPYMAFVMVTPYYEFNNPQPIMLKFNELVHKKKQEDKPKEEPLMTIIQEEQLL